MGRGLQVYALSLGLAIGAIATARGADPAGPFDPVEVTLVQIEVTVTDRAGEPVTGLGRDDFELLEEKRPVPLVGFSAFGGHPSPAADEHPAFLAIYLDRTFLELGDLSGIREALGLWVASLDPQVRVMLVSSDGGILHGLGGQREGLLARLGELPEEPGRSRVAAEHASLLEEIQRLARQGADPRFQGTAGAQPQLLLTRVGALAERAYRELESSTARLHRLLDALAGLPGRREVLYLGGRLPASAGQSLYAAWLRAFGRSSPYWMSADGPQGPTADSDPGGAGGGGFETLPEGSTFLDTSPLLGAVAAHAAAEGVTFHTFDIGALSGAGRAADTAALRSLAQATGGLLLTRRGGLDSALEILGRGRSAYYLLALEPPRGADDAAHEVRVRLPGHRGLQVRHRPSYRPRSRDHQTAQQAVSALLLGVTDNRLGVEVTREGGEMAAGGALRLTVRVPLADLALVADGRSHRGQLSVFIAAGDGVEGVRKAVVPVRIGNDEILASQGLKVEYVTEIPSPGPGGRLAVAVRDDLQGLTSTVSLGLGEGSSIPEGGTLPSSVDREVGEAPRVHG